VGSVQPSGGFSSMKFPGGIIVGGACFGAPSKRTQIQITFDCASPYDIHFWFQFQPALIPDAGSPTLSSALLKGCPQR